MRSAGPANGLSRSLRWLVLACLVAQTSLSAGAALPPENDAGSGGDAPDGPDAGFLIEEARRYRGRLVASSDTSDWYAFVPPARDTETSLRFWSSLARCPTIYLPSLQVHEHGLCDPGPHAGGVWFYTGEVGTYYIEVERWAPPGSPDVPRPDDPGYEFQLDFDLIVPTVNGEGAYVHDDAGSGRDAAGGGGTASYVWPDPGVVYKGRLWSVFDDVDDWYRLDIFAAETIEVRLAGLAFQCPRLLDPYEPVPSTCRQEADGTWVMTAVPRTEGRHYFTVAHVGPTPYSAYAWPVLMDYSFSYALDAAAPDPTA